MNSLKLVFPSEEYRVQILDYKEEFRDSIKTMNGSSGLREINDFDNWLEQVRAKQRGEVIGKYNVPATNYIVIRKSDNRMIGFVDIRHELNDFFMNHAGHIGYSVRKSERRKVYAKEMLALALERCKTLDLDKVLITCAKGNIGSAKTIKARGGVYENETSSKGEVMERYWINLK